MAYRSIASTETDPDAPITSALMKALAENPTEIASGASGPQIQTAAIANNAVTAAKLASGSGENGWVGDRIINLGLGGVGTYAFLCNANNAISFVAGTSYSGSDLKYSGVRNSTPPINPGATLNFGTWKAMGTANDADQFESATLFLRLA